MHGRLQKYIISYWLENKQEKKIVILIFSVSVEETRIPPGQQKPQMDACDFFSMPAQLIGKGALFFATQMVRERELKALQDISQRHV